MFWSKNKKNRYTPIPQFFYIKVGFKGVYISRTCFPDGWFPSFICFSYFHFQEQELSFDIDSSSSILILVVNMKCISYFMYLLIIHFFFSPLFFNLRLFLAMLAVTFFPSTRKYCRYSHLQILSFVNHFPKVFKARNFC